MNGLNPADICMADDCRGRPVCLPLEQGKDLLFNLSECWLYFGQTCVSAPTNP